MPSAWLPSIGSYPATAGDFPPSVNSRWGVQAVALLSSYESVLAALGGPPPTIIFNVSLSAPFNPSADPRIVAVVDTPWKPEDLSLAVTRAKQSRTWHFPPAAPRKARSAADHVG
jgi:hypothetical protein